MRPARLLPLLALTLAVLLVAAPHAHAAAGDLDTTFDGDGVNTTDFGGVDQGVGIAVDGSGRIVVAGVGGASPNFIVARYLSTGPLDTTFSNDGMKSIDMGSNDEIAYDVAVQTDGKIVVAGYTFRSATSYNFAVVRLLPNGNLDNSFSGDGKTVNDFSRNVDAATGVALQANGKIVVAGGATTAQSNEGFGVMRYNANGTLDTTFSGDGKALTNFTAQPEIATDVLIEPGGKLVLVGYRIDGQDFFDMAMARFNPGGTVDGTFSGDGRLLHSVGSYTQATAVARQSDGSFLVAGHAKDPDTGWNDYDWIVVKVSSGGVVDSGWSSRITFGLDDDFLNNAVRQTDGKLVMVGATNTVDIASMALARIDPSDGSLDATFGDGGKVVTNLGGIVDSWYDVTLQSDGKIVVSGVHADEFEVDLAVGRYLAA